MSDEYNRYLQRKEHKETSALGFYVQMQDLALIDKYINQKMDMTTSELFVSALTKGFVKAIADILEDMFE